MIGALNGTVFTKERNPLIILVGGVGYSVFVTDRLRSQLRLKQKVTLYTQTYVREDTLALYGFPDREELGLFELLQTVSGIGPRTALLVAERGVISVKKAVAESDVDFFTTIPRLGRKNAQKIIIELKSKLGSVRELDLTDQGSSETKEILEALTGMGFTRKEAFEVVKKLGPRGTLEDKVKQALQMLGRKLP